MSLKGKKGSWSLPSYDQSGVIGFENPLGRSTWRKGRSGTNAGAFGFEFNPETQDYYNMLTAMRDAIYSQLGYTSPAREASLNRWENTFNREALRTSMPRLEQTLFERGLGGSKFYNDAVTDLLSKVATQGVLNREQLSRADEAMKLNYLASINPQVANLINQANLLAGKSYGATQKQYENLFPYLAKYKSKKGFMDILGGGLGGLAGFMLGGPAGAMTGYSLGSGLGNMFNIGPQSQFGGTLSNLANLVTLDRLLSGSQIPAGATTYGGGAWGMSTPYTNQIGLYDPITVMKYMGGSR